MENPMKIDSSMVPQFYELMIRDPDVFMIPGVIPRPENAVDNWTRLSGQSNHINHVFVPARFITHRIHVWYIC